MKNIYIKEDDITDIDKLDEYNNEYLNYYSDFEPFATPDNYKDILKNNKLVREGLGNNGVKEIYYWVIENDKIIGHASIRLNPEVDEDLFKYCGHIMYGVVPNKRKQGYGTSICHLLIEKMEEMGYKDIYITCNEDNIGSSKVIENNGGKLIEVLEPDMKNAIKRTKRYYIDVDDLKRRNQL